MNEIVKQNTLSYTEYNSIPAVPFQRDTELRANKPATKKKFKTLRPEHLLVSVGVLTKDCTYYGKSYKKGYQAIVDSNTRKFYWDEGRMEKPKVLFANFINYDSMEAMWEGYNCFDSVTSAESTAEKMTGQALLTGVQFISEKLRKGTYVTALNYAAHALYPNEYSSTNSQQTSNTDKFLLFKEELLILDDFNLGQKVNQAVLSAMLMALKCHTLEDTEDRVLDFIKKYQDGYSDCTSKEKDGVTHAVEEIYKQQPGLFGWGTAYKEMLPQISFVLHSIDNYVSNIKTTKYTPKPLMKNSTATDYYSDYANKHGFGFLSKMVGRIPKKLLTKAA